MAVDGVAVEEVGGERVSSANCMQNLTGEWPCPSLSLKEQ